MSIHTNPSSSTAEETAAYTAALLELLGTADPADLQRVGLHAERGEESVDRLLRLYAGHDLLHLGQIARIRRAVAPDQSALP